jgi:phosphatidylglycerol:prolipoprotein diacylglycerol transferase
MTLFCVISFPVKVMVFGHSIWLHTIMESLGVFIGMRLYFYNKRKLNSITPFLTSLYVLIGATAGALIGTKLIGNLEDPQQLFHQPFSFIRFWTNNTIVGGLMFGLIGVEFAKKLIKHNESTGDPMVLPLIIAIAIGRIGCFFTGVYEGTYGLPTTSILGMYLGDAYLRHPVALYEIAFLIVLTIFLKWFKKRYSYNAGVLFQLFMLSYFTFRFLLDFIKPRVYLIANLGTIQICCLLVMGYYLWKLKKEMPFISKN